MMDIITGRATPRVWCGVGHARKLQKMVKSSPSQEKKYRVVPEPGDVDWAYRCIASTNQHLPIATTHSNHP